MHIVTTSGLMNCMVSYIDNPDVTTPPGEFTYKYIDRVFTSSISEKIFWTPLMNSLTVSFFATLIALTLGLILASLVHSENGQVYREYMRLGGHYHRQ